MGDDRIVLLTNMIAPYRIPVFNAIAKQNTNFHVIFLSHRELSREWDVPEYKIEFSYEILEKSYPTYLKKMFGFNPKIINSLIHLRPKILIIGGWGYIENWLSLFYSKLMGIPVVIWGGMNQASYKRNGFITRMLRTLFIRMADSIISYSSIAADEFKRLGAKANRITVGYNVGDVQYFYRKVKEFRQSAEYQTTSCKHRKPVFLYVGQLVERKGLIPLFKALKQYSMNSSWELFIVGSGPDENKLHLFCSDNGLTNVHFTGFLQGEELVRFFALADVFILPSLRESGAIVLSEALASGLYVLASENDGIAPDLIRPGENGEFINPMNIQSLSEQLSNVIDRCVDDVWNRDDIADEFMRNIPVERYANAFLEGVRSATKKS